MQTAVVCYVIGNAVCVAVAALLWRQNRGRFAGPGFWLAGFGAQFAGGALAVLRGVAPDWMSILAGNALIAAGPLLLYVGMEHFADRRTSQVHKYVLLATFTAVHAYFAFVRPSLLARNVNISLAMGLAYAQCAWLMLRRAGADMRPITRDVGALSAAFILVALTRIGLDLTFPPGDDFLAQPLGAFFVLMNQALSMALAFSLSLVVNRRLQAELERELEARRRAEAALRESEARFHMALKNSPVVVFIQDRELRYTWIHSPNPGFDAAAVLGKTDAELLRPEDAEHLTGIKRRVLETGAPARAEVITNIGAQAFIYDLSVEPLCEGAGGVTCVAVDITKRKQAEAALARALDERDTLFRELQHRVKNSFAMISSLAGLEAEQAEAPGAKQALESLQGRILTLANLYSSLTAGGAAQDIRLDQYLGEVARSIIGALAGDGRVEMRLDLDAVTVSARQATAFGLTLNELLTNALKHAFPQGRRGAVSACLRREDGGMFLEVADDGAGLPPGFSLDNAQGLGLVLVRMLAQQLGGQAYYSHDEMTHFGIRLPGAGGDEHSG